VYHRRKEEERKKREGEEGEREEGRDELTFDRELGILARRKR
jgi:hypothetical protein